MTLSYEQPDVRVCINPDCDNTFVVTAYGTCAGFMAEYDSLLCPDCRERRKDDGDDDNERL